MPKVAISSHQQTSIHSFYQREVPITTVLTESSTKVGDGFTEEELATTLDPLNRKWDPEREYDEVNIAQLVPGPRAVTFAGRIVNLKTIMGMNPKQPKANGWHSLIVKDDSSAIEIKLYFAHQQYPLELGQLITCWTIFISNKLKSDAVIAPKNAILVSANIFPGRVTSDHVIIHTSANTDGICHTPLGYQRGVAGLPGLLNVSQYITGGHDSVAGAKILVCVKSLGYKKTITRKDGKQSDLVELTLFDHTGDVRVTFWNDAIKSTATWQPRQTVLLISSPAYKTDYGKGSLGILPYTMIDIDPEIPDAIWLREYAAGLTKRETLNQEFPEGVWDVDAARNGVVRMLFTLADLDTWIRSDGHQVFTGFLSLTILELNMDELHRKMKLMCGECCGVPIYSNTCSTTCRSCSKSVILYLNPKMIGSMVDETGQILGSRLLWSPDSWKNLLGVKVETFVGWTGEEIRLLEQRILFIRIHFLVGWKQEAGRLCVLGVDQ